MARYIGAVCRVCRRQNEKLMLKGERCLSRKCALEKRNSPPGQQKKSHKRKISDRGLQLREKQKTRFTYGIVDRKSGSSAGTLKKPRNVPVRLAKFYCRSLR